MKRTRGSDTQRVLLKDDLQNLALHLHSVAQRRTALPFLVRPAYFQAVYGYFRRSVLALIHSQALCHAALSSCFVALFQLHGMPVLRQLLLSCCDLRSAATSEAAEALRIDVVQRFCESDGSNCDGAAASLSLRYADVRSRRSHS